MDLNCKLLQTTWHVKKYISLFELHLDLQFSLWSWEYSQMVSMNGTPQACNFNNPPPNETFPIKLTVTARGVGSKCSLL